MATLNTSRDGMNTNSTGSHHLGVTGKTHRTNPAGDVSGDCGPPVDGPLAQRKRLSRNKLRSFAFGWGRHIRESFRTPSPMGSPVASRTFLMGPRAASSNGPSCQTGIAGTFRQGSYWTHWKLPVGVLCAELWTLSGVGGGTRVTPPSPLQAKPLPCHSFTKQNSTRSWDSVGQHGQHTHHGLRDCMSLWPSIDSRTV